MAPSPGYTYSEEWRRILERGDHFRPYRQVLRLLPSDPRCELCRVPFSGVGGALVRAVKGIRPSTLNPRFCNDCELLGDEYPGGAETDVAMLFVDIRGSTTLAEGLTPWDFSAVIDRFYRAATAVLIDADALIEKLIGDEVTAIFAPGFAGRHYVRRAIEAGARLLELGDAGHDGHVGVPLGVGVHAGRAFVGAVGTSGGMTTISALGDTVNVAARLVSLAGPGEMFVSDSAYHAAGLDDHRHPAHRLELKGRTTPVGVRVMTVATSG
jgi:adenylate cyclase